MNSQSLEDNETLYDSSYANCDIKKRQRSDKISNLMGQYLLKGWRMLNESCPKCETILFQQPNGQYYCVACLEVDQEKPNSIKEPLLGNQRLLNKSQNFSTESSPFRNDVDIGLPKKFTDPQMKPLSDNKQTSTNACNEISILTELRDKIHWSMSQLVETTTPMGIRQWVDTLKSLLDLWDKLLKSNFVKS
ncbi:unnamed protein product [Schistosoma rodhaini]|uniref:Sjoegren syndrome/scleroderma autoantigen 1 n=1 Tax=Schistosoma rodhaini TaxID=6188 RepID=A0AA85EN37_9TREM|nr:unnamed protein product [Schistosoma rodhaini]CAH8660020.1 unnamed protein product [Schistosoma rodhaini]